MDDLAFVIGLMRQNTDALGFIPDTTLENRYVAAGRYLIQENVAGQRVGYLLHGKPKLGGVLTIAQAVIEYDQRERGFGNDVVKQLIERAERHNVRSIVLHCADDLDANRFWQSVGFDKTDTLHVANQRRRAINVYTLDLWPTLWSNQLKDAS